MIEVLRSFAERVDPAHTAILVVDMQNDFCAEGGYIHRTRKADMSAHPALAQRIGALVGSGRDAGTTIVWITANYEPRFLSGAMILKRDERDGLVCCAGGSWGAALYEVEPQEGDLLVEKHTFSAFVGTPLDQMLRARGIKTLVMTGVATNTCVESTLRDGFFLGYYVVVAEDCCASSAKHLHDATLDNVRRSFGEVVDAAALGREWGLAAAAE
ncbi:MAG TPA: isochorismatase family cysteine hydrolase [Hyphomicrobiales bacterium]|nr:isochorismatase family cysteine hydrolase [Hyphomicrobiales bacterium]